VQVLGSGGRHGVGGMMGLGFGFGMDAVTQQGSSWDCGEEVGFCVLIDGLIYNLLVLGDCFFFFLL